MTNKKDDDGFDDLFTSRAERDAGMELVAENNPQFVEQVVAVVAQLPSDWIGSGEDIRLICQELGIKPKHHNGWGSVVGIAFKKHKLLRKTGKWVCMKERRSHARLTPQYARA
jgi:hypothetical protein